MTHCIRATVVAGLCLACPAAGFAQGVVNGADRPAATTPASDTPAVPRFAAPSADGFWAPFTALPGDLVRLVSTDTVKIVGVAGAGAAVIAGWDDEGMKGAQSRLRPASLFTPGNIGGGFLAQTGASIGAYALGRLTGSDTLSAVGSDLIRAQFLSQAIVQAGKFMTDRPRPDGSNDQSLPSGHTASAFATATVLERHFGWKVGAAAYGFGAYVAVSRMAANKHHLSDVIMGAAVGIAAARTVTIGAGGTRFELGITPTVGGAAVMFTRQ